MDSIVPISCSAAAASKTNDFSLTVFDTIESVPVTQWNKLVPEANRLMLYDQLQLIETTQKDKLQFRYVLIKNADDTTAGIIYFQIVHFTGSDLLNYFPETPEQGFKKYLYGIAKAISAPVIRSIDLKMLVVGNIFMTGENGFYFQHDIPLPLRALLVRKAIDGAAKTDNRIRAILISDLYEPKTDFDTDFKQCDYSMITVEADMNLKLHEEWKTFADYLNALSSKYRVRAKKAFSLFRQNEIVCKELNGEEIARYEDQLFALYEKLISRADFKLGTLTKDYFRLQKKLLPDNYSIFGYFKNDELIGFISAFHFAKKMEVHYTGMDHEVANPMQLYQNMLYNMIEFGIIHKMEKLHFGRTAPEIKSTVGATPSPMYGYIKHLNFFFNFFIVRTFTARLKPKHYVMRSPFKE